MKKILALAFVAMMSIGAMAQTAQQVLDKTAAVIGNKGGASANFKMSSSTPCGKYSEDINSKHIKQYPKYIPKLIKSFKVSQHFGGFFFIIRTANLIKQSHPQFSFSNQLYSSSSGVVLL